MRIGLTLYAQNYQDWDRFNALERKEDVPPLEPNTDASIWAEEIESVLRIEEQGFDSLWTVEHHVSPYTMVTNPLQTLAFFAGATSRIDVGTMVVVAPWHNPLRLAEDITSLQTFLRGRRAFVGFGRGLGRREFKALGVDQNEARDRFREGVEVVRLALSQEAFDYSGTIYQYEHTTMRPRPRDARQLLDDMCFSWGSPSSASVGAGLGLRPLIIPQRAFAEYHKDLEEFARAREGVGLAPARPRIHLHMYCDADAAKAEEMARRAIPQYVDSANRNYELTGDHFKAIKGYEHYDQMSKMGRDQMAEAWISNCIWGTPEMCVQKIQALCDAFHPDEFMLTGRYGAMPYEVSQKSIDLFAREVLPAVQAIPVEEPISYQPATV